jgi:hypothetical protein
MISFKRSRLIIVAVCTAAAFAVGGIAYASIPDPSGAIHGCYNTGSNPSGQLRVIDTGKGAACSKNEQALSWNQTGPRGPEGPPVPPAPRGPRGAGAAPGPTYSAGAGLSLDGSTNTFGIQGSYQLPQGCSNGQTPFLLGTPLTHPWSCFTAANADKSCPSGQFQNGVDADGDPTCALPSSGSSSAPELWVTRNGSDQDTPEGVTVTVATLSLPSGSFLLTGEGSAEADLDGDSVNLGCFFDVDRGPEGDTSEGDDDLSTFSVNDVVTLAAPTDVSLDCGSAQPHTHVARVVMTALKLGTVNQQ